MSKIIYNFSSLPHFQFRSPSPFHSILHHPRHSLRSTVSLWEPSQPPRHPADWDPSNAPPTRRHLPPSSHRSPRRPRFPVPRPPTAPTLPRQPLHKPHNRHHRPPPPPPPPRSRQLPPRPAPEAWRRLHLRRHSALLQQAAVPQEIPLRPGGQQVRERALLFIYES